MAKRDLINDLVTRANTPAVVWVAVMAHLFRCLGQAPAPKPEIDVASIRQNHAGGRSGVRFTPGNGGPIATNVTLKYLIQWAYDVEDYQVSGRPKWIDSTSFDITAKLTRDVNPTGDPAQRAYFREMFQPVSRMDSNWSFIDRCAKFPRSLL